MMYSDDISARGDPEVLHQKPGEGEGEGEGEGKQGYVAGEGDITLFPGHPPRPLPLTPSASAAINRCLL